MIITDEDRADIRDVKRRVEDRLLLIPGVTGVDIGEKITAGRPAGVAAIIVYVTRKLPGAEVPPEQLIPERIDGVPTDVQEMTILPQPGAIT